MIHEYRSPVSPSGTVRSRLPSSCSAQRIATPALPAGTDPTRWTSRSRCRSLVIPSLMRGTVSSVRGDPAHEVRAEVKDDREHDDRNTGERDERAGVDERTNDELLGVTASVEANDARGPDLVPGFTGDR